MSCHITLFALAPGGMKECSLGRYTWYTGNMNRHHWKKVPSSHPSVIYAARYLIKVSFYNFYSENLLLNQFALLYALPRSPRKWQMRNALFRAIDRIFVPFHGISRGMPLYRSRNRGFSTAPAARATSHVHSQPGQHHRKQEAPSRTADRLDR